MATMEKLIIITLLFLSSGVQAMVQEKEVTYSNGGEILKGYIAYDDSIKGKRPGVLVVHEWWGHNEYARKRARMLAELGYTALALDMYGDGKQAHHPDEAGKFSGEMAKNLPLAKARFEAAMKFLKEQPNVDANNIAALGYCFGGSVVLQMARLGETLKGVASFHGGLATQTPAQPGKVKAHIISFTGADEPQATPRSRWPLSSRKWNRLEWITRLSCFRESNTASLTLLRTKTAASSICRLLTMRPQTPFRGKKPSVSWLTYLSQSDTRILR